MVSMSDNDNPKKCPAFESVGLQIIYIASSPAHTAAARACRTPARLQHRCRSRGGRCRCLRPSLPHNTYHHNCSVCPSIRSHTQHGILQAPKGGTGCIDCCVLSVTPAPGSGHKSSREVCLVTMRRVDEVSRPKPMTPHAQLIGAPRSREHGLEKVGQLIDQENRGTH